MDTPSQRNYLQSINRLINSLNANTKIYTIGHIETTNKRYPFYKFILGKDNPRRLLISAGIHGDEPSGFETICSFLESGRYQTYLDEWEITILPCINPYGFEYNKRENNDNKDLNRLFKELLPPSEVQLAKTIIKPSYFDLTIELHEDCDSEGYYLFQKSNNPNGLKIGIKIIKTLQKIIPINLNKSIDTMPAEHGIIHRLKNIEDMEWWPMAGYSFAMQSGHCLTLESPTQLAMSTRVKSHLLAMDQAIIYLSTKPPIN